MRRERLEAPDRASTGTDSPTQDEADPAWASYKQTDLKKKKKQPHN